MKLQNVCTALTLCLLATPVMAEDTLNLDDLQIPENLGPKGRAGLAKFYGRPLVVEDGKWKGILHFEANGRVAWTRPNGKTKHGHFGDSARKQEMCLDFSVDFNDCFEVQQQGNDLHFYKEGEAQFSGHADQGDADAALPDRDPQICAAVATILKAGRADKLSSLIDDKKDAVPIGQYAEPSYWTTVQLNDEFCLYDKNGVHPAIDCDVYFNDDAPDAEKLYEAFVGQLRVCAKDHIKEADIDSDTWHRYVEYDYLKRGFRKIAKQDFKPGLSDSLRSSKFEFSGGMQVNVSLGSRLICKDVVDCKAIYGVWSSFQRQ
jgi:hypothetical protein